MCRPLPALLQVAECRRHWQLPSLRDHQRDRHTECDPADRRQHQLHGISAEGDGAAATSAIPNSDVT
jgi:hypothetical protein